MAGPITPSKIAATHACVHYYRLECFGDRSKLREVSEGEDLRMKKGISFEREVVLKIEGAETTPWEYPDFKTGYVKTMELLKKGPAWIHRGVLLSRNFLGIPDLLRRTPRSSKLGHFSYEPIDVKSHKEVKNVVFDAEVEKNFFNTLDQMKRIEEKKLKTSPIRCSTCQTCLWINQCTETWIENDDVSLLPRVGVSLSGKLKSVGITTCQQVSEANPQTLSKKLNQKFESVDRLVQAAKSLKENKPYTLHAPSFPDGVPIYFYDIETLGSSTVVHGVIRLYQGKREEKSFYAESLGDEKKIWHALLEFLSQDKKAAVYCWTMFEQSHARELWSKHGGNESGYALLEKNLTDQCAFVRDHFVLPCRGYSIKQVAPVFGFHWRAEDAGGGNCEAWYGRWLETGDRELRKKIIEYNLDDVRAMEVIQNALKKMCQCP